MLVLIHSLTCRTSRPILRTGRLDLEHSTKSFPSRGTFLEEPSQSREAVHHFRYWLTLSLAHSLFVCRSFCVPVFFLHLHHTSSNLFLFVLSSLSKVPPILFPLFFSLLLFSYLNSNHNFNFFHSISSLLARIIMLAPDTVDPVVPHKTRWKYVTQALSSITVGLHLPEHLTQSSVTLRAGEGAGVGVIAMEFESTYNALTTCRRHLVLLKGFIRGILQALVYYLFNPFLPHSY